MKRSDNLIRALSFLIFAALACYIGFYIYDRVNNPLITAEAQPAQTVDSISLDGWVVRDEQAVWVDGEFYSFEISDGQKLRAGQSLASVYTSEAAYARAQQRRQLLTERDSLEKLSNADGARQAVYESIITMNRAARLGSRDELETAVIGVESLLIGGGVDIATRLEQIDTALRQLETASLADTQYISAPAAGLFSSVSDGHERVGTKSVTGLSPTELEALFSTAAPGDCKLVTGISWCYAAVADVEAAAKLAVGDTVHLAPDSLGGIRFEMTVSHVGAADSWGKCTVVLSSNRDLEQVLSLRRDTAQLILSDSAAVSIPKAALLRDKEGNAFVYIISGLQTRRVDVEIVELDGEYAVIRSDDRRLSAGVEIIVQASDLYDGKVVG